MNEQPTGPDSGGPPGWSAQPGQPGSNPRPPQSRPPQSQPPQPGWGPRPGYGPPPQPQPGYGPQPGYPPPPRPDQQNWGMRAGPPGWGPPAPPKKGGMSKGCLIALVVTAIVVVLGIGAVVAGGLFVAGKVNEAAEQSAPGSDRLPEEIDGLKLLEGGVTGLACSLGARPFDGIAESGKIGSYCYADDAGAFAMAIAGRGEAFEMTGSAMLGGGGDGTEPESVDGAECVRDTGATVICVASENGVTALVVTSGGVGENTAAEIAVTVAGRVG
ncbi:hypothetical protein ACQP1K_15370 [Sphaerimonospora sp. CA-214678]|uniref:hypothetical protein n=1 Tax=Sphaerimonospora sp. CA-214678 TaxID=3240029 RepID=UPI003D8C5F65